ncbi:MAG: ribosomal protein S18-alanine N-acetyltransferase [Bacilli bacterium]|nr:ribosomal protein S18-alanine N-acetyltransferase [Bacilli bacterium]
MLTLLLDSSASALSVGLAEGENLIDEIQYEASQRQSEFMVDEIGKLFDKHSVKKGDLSGVVVTKGPGSYTGVRIALTVAKTVAFAWNVKLYLVSSLEILKDPNAVSLCLSNARSKRSYAAIYDGEKAIMEDRIMDNKDVLSLVAEHPEYVVCGDTKYLGIEGKRINLLANLALRAKDSYVVEPLGAKPIYLKDSTGSSEMKVIVRPMISADMSQIMEIENASFKHPYDQSHFQYELLENPFAHVLVATVDSLVVGFIDFMITFDSATINQIAVKEALRAKGIGTRLIGEMIRVCKEQKDEVDFVTLEVRASNLTAQKFYKRHAFELITTKKAYYDDGEDALYYVRSIIND